MENKNYITSRDLAKYAKGNKAVDNELKRREEKEVDTGLIGINGERVIFTQEDALVSRLMYIHLTYNSIKDLKINNNQILLDSYHSATIEGAKTTVDKVIKVLNNENKLKTKDEKMVINTLYALNSAYRTKITKTNIFNFWKIITKDVCENKLQAGNRYRTGMVYLHNGRNITHTPEKPENIEDKMKQLFEFMDCNESEIDTIIKSIIIHFYFVYIHPFCDGNGRMARVINAQYLFHNGYDKFKNISIAQSISSNLIGYYKSLELSEEVYKNKIDITPFILYMTEVIESAISYRKLLENELSDIEKAVIEKMKKHGNNAEITAKKCASMLNISNKEALKVLNNLVDIGVLTKRRERVNIYKLK